MISGDFAFYATGRWVGSSQAAACRRSRSRYGCCTVTGCIRKRPHLSIPHVLGAALPIISLALVFRPQLAALAARAPRRDAPASTALYTVLTGAVLGALVSLTSVGAGAIGVTVLLLLYPLLPTTRVVGSDIAHAVPLTLVAGMGHWFLGSVDGAMLLSLLIGSLPGIALGSYLSARSPEALLRYLLAAVLVLVGFRLVWA